MVFNITMIEESLNKNTCMNVDKITLGIGKKKKTAYLK